MGVLAIKETTTIQTIRNTIAVVMEEEEEEEMIATMMIAHLIARIIHPVNVADMMETRT